MVADLVHQHMADDGAQRLVVLGPIVQDRPAVQPDHVRQSGDVVVALLRQADALEQPEQVELGLGLHLVEHLVGREIVDPDDQVVAQRAKIRRKPGEHLMSHRFEFGQRR